LNPESAAYTRAKFYFPEYRREIFYMRLCFL